MDADELRLYTFAVSHFSEKIRWCLDASDIAYREIAWTPSLHLGRAYFKSGRGTTVPIIETGDEVVQDSTDILHWLSRNRAPFALLPADAEARREVLEIEERFDRVGKYVIRHAYGAALEDPRAVQTVWLFRSNALEKKLLPLLFPAIKPVFRRMFRIEPRALARAEEEIRSGIDWLEARIGEGRRHLVGDRLTVADVTAAALLAPLACPDEHPVYSTESYRAGVKRAIDPFRERPALEWVRALYRSERTKRPA